MNSVEDLKGMEHKVCKVLETHQKAREDDILLYLIICKGINENCLKMPFDYVLANADVLGLPRFDTVARARRRTQEKRADLQATDNAKTHRKRKKDIYEEWARL